MDFPMNTLNPIGGPRTGTPTSNHPFQNSRDSIFSHNQNQQELFINRGQRVLCERHVVTLAIDCVLGTGVLLRVGRGLQNAGPVGLLLGFGFIGVAAWLTMSAMCEMCVRLPNSAPLSRLASKFVHPALGFTGGFFFFFSYSLYFATGIAAVLDTIRASCWHEDCWAQPYVPALGQPTNTSAGSYAAFLLMLLSIGFNMIPLRAYAELSFFMAIIKVVGIFTLIVFSWVFTQGLIAPHEALGQQFWHDPGPFAQFSPTSDSDVTSGVPGATGRALGWLGTFPTAAFSYYGLEVMFIASGDVSSPAKTLPRGKKTLLWWTLGLYMGSIFLVGSAIPWKTSDQLCRRIGVGSTACDSSLDNYTSPFRAIAVVLRSRALTRLIDLTAIFFSFSGATAALYAASRALRALLLPDDREELGDERPEWLPRLVRSLRMASLDIEEWSAPKWGFLSLTTICVFISAMFGLLIFTADTYQLGEELYNKLGNIASVAGLLTWWTIPITFLYFHRAFRQVRQNEAHADEYRSGGQPIAAWFSLSMLTAALILAGLQPLTTLFRGSHSTSDVWNLVTSYLSVVIFALCYLSVSWYHYTYNGRSWRWCAPEGVQEEMYRAWAPRAPNAERDRLDRMFAWVAAKE